jgi:hypothetical protein
MAEPTGTSILDAATAQFILRRVSMYAAGRDAANAPVAARAYGCRVAEDRGTLTVFVMRQQATELLNSVAANRQVAVVFSRPTTHRTVQFKGLDARVTPLEPGDGQVIAEWVGSFVVELAELGFNAPFVHAACATQPDDMAAIRFTPSDGFAQTPGPGAGSRLGAPSGPPPAVR